MDTTQSGPASGPTPPPPFGRPAPRELRRRPDQGPIAGVCAGVADYFRVDPIIVRIATVVLAISGPGVIAYLLAWVFVPAADATTAAPANGPRGERPDRGAQVLGIVLLAVAVSVLWGGWWSPARRWLLPVGLIVLGTWLLLRRADDDGAPPPLDRPEPAPTPTAPLAPTPPTSSTPTAPGFDVSDATDVTDTADATLRLSEPPAPDGPPAPPPPYPWGAAPPSAAVSEAALAARRRRRMVAPVVLGLLLLWAGVAALVGVSMEAGLAVALSIIGIGFVLGAFVGGSKALIVPAVLVGAALVVSSVADIPLSGPIGQRSWAPGTPVELADRYELSIGEGTLDLSNLDLEGDESVEVTATVGVGHLVVLVPRGAAVDVTAAASVGETVVFGEESSGLGVATERSFAGTPRGGELVLDLEVGIGQIEVVRAS